MHPQASVNSEKSSSNLIIVQVADQSGRSLQLPAAEKKALIIAMSLHEKGRAALLTGDYSLGISLFTTAENSYKSCFRTKTIFLVEISGHFTIHVLQPVLRIRIRWIRKILASWIRIRIRGSAYFCGSRGKISTKNCNKTKF